VFQFMVMMYLSHWPRWGSWVLPWRIWDVLMAVKGVRLNEIFGSVSEPEQLKEHTRSKRCTLQFSWSPQIHGGL